MPWREWRSADPVLINRIVWDEGEEEALNAVLDSDWFGPGAQVSSFETELGQMIGADHVLACNSGSSALMLAVSTLLEQGVWRPGDLILHPALTFPTSVNPLFQRGLVPVFVDVQPGTYVIDAEMVSFALTKHPGIKGAVIPHLLGNVPDMDKLTKALGERVFIEDCCDTLGGSWQDRPLGSFGAFAAFSFYGSHHISTAGVGGALVSRDEESDGIARSMCYWGRRLTVDGDPYQDFVNRYTYETMGFDFQMTELQAAFGRVQLTRLFQQNIRRLMLFQRYLEELRPYEGLVQLPEEHHGANPSWFAFPITIKDDAPFDREHVIRRLIDAKVEVRPLFTGNITLQPAYMAGAAFLRAGGLTEATRCGRRSFFVPCFGAMTYAQQDIVLETLVAAFQEVT